MTLVLELPSELESRLTAAAARQGLEPAAYLVQLLERSLAGEAIPRSGVEIVAYWQREGLIGTRPEITDSTQHAEAIRRRAERRSRE